MASLQEATDGRVATTTSELRERLRSHGLQVKPSQPHHDSLRRASVLVILTNDDQILMTQRTLHLKSHPGDVCFPGGKQDEEDKGDDWATGLRETLEEVGLDLKAKVQRLCCLRTVESINHLAVTPLVAFVDQSSQELSHEIKINPTEVELFFWVPLDYFLTTAPVEEYDIPWSGETFVFRRYQYEIKDRKIELPITGLTAYMAHEVARIAFGDDNNMAAMPSNINSREHHGQLWRLLETGTTQRPHWSRKYFILSHGVLHQYDNGRAAYRKSQSASKKNRLLLHKGSVDIQDVEDEKSGQNRFAFRVLALDGQVVWQLAASTKEEQSQWKSWILENAKE